jgi:hypothetical protein
MIRRKQVKAGLELETAIPRRRRRLAIAPPKPAIDHLRRLVIPMSASVDPGARLAPSM